MFWDLANQALQGGVEALHFWMNTLPDSPIYLSASDIAAVSGITQYMAWFLPLPAMAITFGFFVSGVVTWIVVVLVKQLIEALLP